MPTPLSRRDEFALRIYTVLLETLFRDPSLTDDERAEILSKAPIHAVQLANDLLEALYPPTGGTDH